MSIGVNLQFIAQGTFVVQSVRLTDAGAPATLEAIAYFGAADRRLENGDQVFHRWRKRSPGRSSNHNQCAKCNRHGLLHHHLRRDHHAGLHAGYNAVLSTDGKRNRGKCDQFADRQRAAVDAHPPAGRNGWPHCHMGQRLQCRIASHRATAAQPGAICSDGLRVPPDQHAWSVAIPVFIFGHVRCIMVQMRAFLAIALLAMT